MDSRKTKKICWIIFFTYFSFLIYMMFFGFNRSLDGYVNFNFIPFKTIYMYIVHFDKFNFSYWIINLPGNVVVFIPFGILLPLLFKKLRKLIYFSLIFIIGILILEISQITIGVGSFDVDDIILNYSGGLIGFAVFRIWLRNNNK